MSGLDLGPLADVRATWLSSLDALGEAVEAFRERDLLAPSRCHGWARVDLLAHLVAGLEEMLHGVTAPVDTPPDTDAASYWDDFGPEQDPDDAEVLARILQGRRRGSATVRPEGIRRELHTVVAAVRGATVDFDDRARFFQERVLGAADFLAIWVLEVVVHHLDLDPDGVLPPPPAEALAMTRRILAARAAAPLPEGDDVRLVLAGTGRIPVPEEWAGLGLPVLG